MSLCQQLASQGPVTCLVWAELSVTLGRLEPAPTVLCWSKRSQAGAPMSQTPVRNGPNTEGASFSPLSSPGGGRGGRRSSLFLSRACIVLEGLPLCAAGNGIVTFRWQERGGAREPKWKSEETPPALLQTLNGRGERGVGGMCHPTHVPSGRAEASSSCREAETWCRATASQHYFYIKREK